MSPVRLTFTKIITLERVESSIQIQILWLLLVRRCSLSLPSI